MTLKHSPLTELIHAVLDGEASDAEVRELEMRLAADPAARAEFEDWQRLFEALDAVPKEHVPEGLVASIVSAITERPYIRFRCPTGTLPGRKPLMRTVPLSSSRRALTFVSRSPDETTTRYSRFNPSESVSVTCMVEKISCCSLRHRARKLP